MKELLKSFWADESGQGLAEYALIIALITILLVTVIVIFREAIANVFTQVSTVLNNAAAGGT